MYKVCPEWREQRDERGNRRGTATKEKKKRGGGVCDRMSGVTDGSDSGEGDRKERRSENNDPVSENWG